MMWPLVVIVGRVSLKQQQRMTGPSGRFYRIPVNSSLEIIQRLLLFDLFGHGIFCCFRRAFLFH